VPLYFTKKEEKIPLFFVLKFILFSLPNRNDVFFLNCPFKSTIFEVKKTEAKNSTKLRHRKANIPQTLSL
jgi:hypothetical protein